MKNLIACLIAAIIVLGTVTQSVADDSAYCFNASNKYTEDAQNIRLTALKMGWVVGKTISLSFASIIKGKGKLYPKNDVEVCLREQGDKLQIRIQSQSQDAGEAKWSVVAAKKQGKILTFLN